MYKVNELEKGNTGLSANCSVIGISVVTCESHQQAQRNDHFLHWIAIQKFC